MAGTSTGDAPGRSRRTRAVPSGTRPHSGIFKAAGQDRDLTHQPVIAGLVERVEVTVAAHGPNQHAPGTRLVPPWSAVSGERTRGAGARPSMAKRS